MSVFSVLIVGEDVPGSLYRSYRRGFEQLGVEVQGYCPVQARDRGTLLSRSRVGRRLFGSRVAAEFNERVCDELAAAKPGLTLVLKGEMFSAKTVQHLRAVTKSPVVNFYPDDPFSRTRSNRLVFGPGVLASYDLCFTFARHLMGSYREAGVADVRYLPFARDPELHGPAPGFEVPRHEIAFIGNLDAERIYWLEAIANHDVVVFGEHTRKALRRGSALRGMTFLPAVYGAGFARAIRQGVIALNVMRRQNAMSHNMRSFESPACAAFTLSQRTPELVQLFREDDEIVCFGSPEELRSKVAHWLAAPPGARDAIAARGFLRVEHDTYAKRAQAILEASRSRTSSSLH